jgi:putative sensory transduction regulator
MLFEELKKLAEGEDLKYFIAPDRPVLMLGIAGIYGRYQIVIPLELDGRFIQFRTIGYQSCPSDHPNLPAVLRVLGELNYRLRLTKFGWDPSDGEIAGFADVWLEDGTLTQKQFSRMLQAFVPSIDLSHPRITKTIETGTDPGELRPEDLIGAAAGLPPALRTLLDRIARKKPGTEPDETPEGPEQV